MTNFDDSGRRSRRWGAGMGRGGHWFEAAALGLLLSVAVPAHAAENHPAGTENGPAYVRLPPIAFSVIGPTNKIDKEVSVQIDLELEKGKTEQDFEPYRRNLLDAFLVTLTGLYEDNNPTGAVAPEDLKSHLLEAATDVTGPNFVRSVLLISVGERKHQ